MECTGGWCGVHRRWPRIGGERRDGREGKGGMICGMRKDARGRKEGFAGGIESGYGRRVDPASV